MRSFKTCTLHHILLGWSNQGDDEMGGVCRAHGRDEKCIQDCGCKTWWEETTRMTWVDGKIILERILRKQGGKLWTEFIWLRTGISDGLLWMR
jgi:hypothetical protein